MRRLLQVALLAGAAVGVCPRLPAQDTSYEAWPEFDTYWQLTDQLRISTIAARTNDRDTRTRSALEFGPNLDINVQALRQRRKKKDDTLDHSKRTYLSFRVGYHHIFNSGGADEERVILEMTPRLYLPKSILVSDRHRADLRFIGGNYSWRYRNRLTVERGFRIKRLKLTPYLRGEVYRDSRYDVWNRTAFGWGVIFPVGKHVELEPYYEHDHDTRASPAHINAIGFTFSLYFDRRRHRP